MKDKVIDINEYILNNFVESMRSEDPEIRSQLDFGYSFDRKVIEIFEIRPVWNDPQKIHNYPFVKIRFYKSKNLWKLYWKRASGKWELYEPFSSATHLSDILKVIEQDSYGCFKG